MLCYCWPLPMPMPTPRRLRLPCACGALARVGRTKGRTCCVVLCCTVVWCALLLCCCILCRPLCRSSHQPPAKSSSLQMMKSVREWGSEAATAIFAFRRISGFLRHFRIFLHFFPVLSPRAIAGVYFRIFAFFWFSHFTRFFHFLIFSLQ